MALSSGTYLNPPSFSYSQNYVKLASAVTNHEFCCKMLDVMQVTDENDKNISTYFVIYN